MVVKYANFGENQILVTNSDLFRTNFPKKVRIRTKSGQFGPKVATLQVGTKVDQKQDKRRLCKLRLVMLST